MALLVSYCSGVCRARPKDPKASWASASCPMPPASAFRHPASQSGTGAFRYRSWPPYQDCSRHRHFKIFLYRTDRMPYRASQHLKTLNEGEEGYTLHVFTDGFEDGYTLHSKYHSVLMMV
jgi:hypothetical protein